MDNIAGKSNDLALRIVKETLQSSTEETVKHIGQSVLEAALSTAIANPLASVLGIVAKELVSALIVKTSSIELKLNAIIDEPLETAATTLKAVLSVQVKNAREMAECNRQLDNAFDNLAKAYTYAEKTNPEKCNLIRLYQSLVASLKEGGEPFAQLYLKELETLAGVARQRAQQAEEEARSIPSDLEKSLFMKYGGRDITIDIGVLLASLETRKSRLLAESRTLEQYADSLDSFCQFVSKLTEKRTEVLSAPQSHH